MAATLDDVSAGPRLLVERIGRVLLVKISNPAMRNAMQPSLYREAVALFRATAADRGIGAVVLAGDGAHFCGGGDLKRLQAQRDLPRETQAANLDALRDWVLAMADAPQPVIAAVEGAAAGAGFSVALGCDLIVAASNANFVMSYVNIALSPDGGGSDALACGLPTQAALELLLDGQPVTSERLHRWGLVNRVVSTGEALDSALQWAERLAAGPSNAQAAIKRLVLAARGRSRHEQLDAERDAFVDNLYGDDCGKRIASFMARRR